MFALVDCNACYASCEQIFRPDLRGKPVVVLSNNDGCIVARNSEAKALNIPGFAPYFKVRPQLERHGVHVFSSNYELYGDISRRIMDLLQGFAGAIEVYSIDEAFLDVAGFADLQQHGGNIRKACWQQQRMPVSVGFAKSKTLAKLANHIAKRSRRLDNVCVIENPDDWSAVFRKLPVNTVWGVGSRLARRLAARAVVSVEDLRRQDDQLIRRDFGSTLECTVRELNGEACLDLETQPPPKQQIFCSRSFNRPVTCLQELKEAIANYAVRAAEKLRLQDSLTRRVYVVIQTSLFSPACYHNSASLALPHPTNDSRMIINAATLLAEHLYREGYAYNKVGVGLLELMDARFQQHDLLDPNQSGQSQSAMKAIDKINRRYGQDAVFFGTQGIQRSWSMARKMKSPAFTTRVNDIPVISL